MSEYWNSGLTIQEYSGLKGTSLRKYPSLDPSLAKAKGTLGWCEQLGIAGAVRGHLFAE